jgi:hypothetical protein
VQENVIGFKRGIGFELTAPIAVLVLLREQPVAGAINGRGYAARKIINFTEA